MIIGAYEQPLTTALALRCLLDQDVDARFEVIVCDDGSSPAFFASLRDLIQAASVPVYWLWQQDHGFREAASLNNGLRAASGRYVVILDGDMIPERDCLRRHLEAHQQPGRLVLGNRLWRSLAPVEAGAPFNETAPLWELLRSDAAIEAGGTFMEFTERVARNTFLGSAAPWRACWSYNLSVERSEAVRFDDNFRGWGFEDMELGYRLAVREGLAVHYDAIVAYHVSNEASNPWLTRRHDDIVAYLRNFAYFRDKWPDAFDGYPMSLLPFELDAATNRWKVGGSGGRDLKRFAEETRRWLIDNGAYEPV